VGRINGGDRPAALATAESLLIDDFVMTDNGQSEAEGEGGVGRHQASSSTTLGRTANDKWTIEKLVPEDDAAACVWRIRATHAESGNRIDVLAADLDVIRDGRIASLRRFLDFEDLRAQTRTRA
jgi:ketosteroid isomerase-like protein